MSPFARVSEILRGRSGAILGRTRQQIFGNVEGAKPT